MSPLLVITLISIVGASTQDVQRSTRIRFPTENSQVDLGQQPHTSESQVQPIIITAGNGLFSTPHYVLPKVPSLANPFGQVGEKGFAEGIIIPYPHTKNQQEFHQTVPPPQQMYFGPPESYFFHHQRPSLIQNSPPKQSNKSQYQQNKPAYHTSKPPQHKSKPTQAQSKPPRPQSKPQTHLPDRHRFGDQRLSYNQLKQLHPTQHAKHQIYASGMHFSADPQNPDVASYRYSIVTNHGPPRESSPDEFEMEIHHGIPEHPSSDHQFPPQHQMNGQSHSFYKTKGQTNSAQKPKTLKRPQSFSDEFFDMNQGIADWEIKGNFDEIPTNPELYFNQNKKGNRQQSNRFPSNLNKKKTSSTTREPQKTYSNPFPNSDKEGENPKRYPFSDFKNSGNFHEAFKQFRDFPEFPSSHKRYFPTKGNSGYKRGEVKSVFPHEHEQVHHDDKHKKKFHHDFPMDFDNLKSIETSGDFSGENFSPDFDFHESPFPKPKVQKSNSNLRGNSDFPKKSVNNTPKQPASDEYNYDVDFPEQSFKKDEKQNQNANYDFEFDYPQRPPKKQKIHQQIPNYDFDYDYSDHMLKNTENHSEHQNFGSEWIPINAPAGAVPAKSFDIPAPDLSRGSFQEKKSSRIEKPREEDEGSLVYGVQKREGSEGVVSAVFRVKQ